MNKIYKIEIDRFGNRVTTWNGKTIVDGIEQEVEMSVIESYDHACSGGIPGYEGRWFYDARGIELFKGCDKCRAEKESRYPRHILVGYNQNDVDEPIEAEGYEIY